MKNVLVLGGSGFVGAHVCEKLVRQGYTVTVPTRRRANAQGIQHLPQLTVLELDVHNEAALQQAVAGNDAVVNLVAILHGSQAAFHKAHVELAQKLARACVTAGVKQVVHVSALGADAQHPDAAPSMYLRSKGQGEAALLQAAKGDTEGGADGGTGFALTVLRPSVIFGAEDKFLNLFAKLQKVFPVMPLAGAHAKFQPVWVQDVAAAVVCSLQDRAAALPNPRVVELCGPDVYTLKELVQMAGCFSGTNAGCGRPVLPLPRWAGFLQALCMECLPGAPLMSRDNLDSMKVDNVHTLGMPGLQSFGLTPAALQPIAQQYLSAHLGNAGLLALRKGARP
jgi:uncharacterized protein YbjT (DUF2867 family)